MRNHTLPKTLSLLAAVALAAQTQEPGTPVQLPPDRPSNGVLELSVTQALAPDPPRPDIVGYPDHVWRGLMMAHLKNISQHPIRLGESNLTYEVTVLDSSGRLVHLPDPMKPDAVFFQVIAYVLQPGATRDSLIGVGKQFQPYTDYTIQVRYERNMPKFDGAGRLILQRELTYTLKAKGGVIAP